MRGSRRLVGLALAALVAVLSGVLAGSPVAAANEALGTTGLAGNGLVRVQPLTGPEVAVVAWSAPVGGRVAIVVTNGTSSPVRVRKVVGIATAPSGGRAVRASTAVVPQVLAPGAWALGSIRFRPGVVGFDDTFTFDVRTGRPRATDPAPLGTGSFVLSPPRTGPVAQTLDLVVTNATSKRISGRVDLQVVCLGEAGTPTGAASRAIKDAELDPGATMPTSVDFASLCNVYVVGAQGRPAR